MNIPLSLTSLLILFVQNEWMFGVDAIIDGSTAGKKEFPFTVSFQKISKSNGHFCGGTLVNEKFVITAAHCVAGQDQKDIRLVTGITNLKTKTKDKNIRKIAHVYTHPDYNKPLPRDNDVALVKLDKPYQLDKFINKVQLAAGNYQVPKDQTVHVAGWGVEKSGSRTPADKLKKTKVQVLEHSQCVKLYQGKLKVSDKVICTAHNGKKNRGVCSGDSGGPVLKDKKILVGVISANYAKVECGDKNHPDIHSEVAKFRQWIDSTISSNNN